MNGLRRKARELALQCLYQVDQSGNPEAGIDLIRQNFQAAKKAVEYGETLVTGVKAHRSELDILIEKHADNWKVGRMAVIDRNILRIALYEMLYAPDVPDAVAVNEALEIAKRFSSDESPAFINGILDAYCKAPSDAG
ncbi:MAG: transcription antitermination factor NusB [Desulfobulbaceae bacterium]|nr:MAG: transcription antitermination factor NusB [Desulfobulbaceae bacterium]